MGRSVSEATFALSERRLARPLRLNMAPDRHCHTNLAPDPPFSGSCFLSRPKRRTADSSPIPILVQQRRISLCNAKPGTASAVPARSSRTSESVNCWQGTLHTKYNTLPAPRCTQCITCYRVRRGAGLRWRKWNCGMRRTTVVDTSEARRRSSY